LLSIYRITITNQISIISPTPPCDCDGLRRLERRMFESANREIFIRGSLPEQERPGHLPVGKVGSRICSQLSHDEPDDGRETLALHIGTLFLEKFQLSVSESYGK